jgi:ATP-dependent RNA helicase RhlE
VNFEKFRLAPAIAANLKALGFETPTPIQSQAIPVVAAGRDVVGLAQTGTGKTAAFVLPMLQKLMQSPGRHVRALIVGPTRELAEQTNKVIHQLGRGTHVHAVTMYGGVGMRPQIDGLRRGAEIVVACPGRLLDHLRQGTIKLDRVEMLILDEADQMFDMGFLPDVRQIIRALPPHCQKLLFSATMPAEIRKLAHDILRDPETIQIAHTAPIETVTHAIFPVEPHLKSPLVIELLKKTDTGPVLIFTRTKHKAKRLAEQLNRQGFKAACLQGNLSQNQRQRAMDGFRSGQFRILVATDIAARGIDVADISHVVNYDIPGTPDAYTHRIGRTGRAAKTGDAFTLVTREDHGMVRQIERILGSQIERKYLDGFDYKAAAPARSHGAHPAPRGHHARGEAHEDQDRQPLENTLAHRRPPAGRPRRFFGGFNRARRGHSH